MPATPTKLIGALLALAALATAWFVLAPGVLGGSTTYVVTEGVSMQPKFHSGDLALVRAAGTYRVGDIVAYRSHELHTIVLHRIVAHDGNRYLFKGDNNNFIDPERPTRDQLVGKLWLHFAGKGHTLLWLGSPKIIAALTGLAVLLLLGSSGAARRPRRHRGRTKSAPKPRPVTKRGTGMQPAPGLVEGGLVTSGFALALCLVLGLLAFTHRGRTPVTTSVPYQQSGVFDYSAAASVGDVYPEGQAYTGDTIFLRLANDVHVRFAYRFHSATPHLMGGTASFAAVLRSSAGWRRTFQLQAPERFAGDRALVDGTISLRPIHRLIARIEAQTAVAGTYTVSFVPHVAVDGSLDGGATSARFAPQLDFTLDALALRPTLPDTGPSLGAAPAPAAQPLTPRVSGTTDVTTDRPTVVALPKLHVRAAVLGRVAALGALLALAALALFALLFRRGRNLAEADRIEARHGHWVVPVTRVETPAGVELVEVPEFETLVRLAERSDRMILHVRNGDAHLFRIMDEGVVYTYSIDDESGSAAASVTPAPASEPIAEEPVAPAPPGPPVRALAAVPAVDLRPPEPAHEPPPTPAPPEAPIAAPARAPALVVPADPSSPFGSPRGKPLLRSPSDQANYLEELRAAGTG